MSCISFTATLVLDQPEATSQGADLLLEIRYELFDREATIRRRGRRHLFDQPERVDPSKLRVAIMLEAIYSLPEVNA
jgi:23S rRNA maturation mini-RNase III